jgi:hypothetical protein
MDYKDFLPTVPEKKLIRRKESVINKEQARKDEQKIVVYRTCLVLGQLRTNRSLEMTDGRKEEDCSEIRYECCKSIGK